MIRKRLLEKVEDLDDLMNSLLKDLNSYNNEKLNKKPNEDTWSPIQVLQHVMLSEKLSLAYCKKKLSFEPKLKKANFLTWINGKLVSWSLISPIKFKAPAAVEVEDSNGEGTIENILDQWVLLRKDLTDFIAQVPEKYIDKEVYKHPFGVRLSLNGMLDFYKNHFRRHRKQIFRRIS